jgi:UDP-N-acetylglucosamine 4-epimerase
LAATTANDAAINQVYNVAVGGRTTLNTLFGDIRALLSEVDQAIAEIEPVYGEFRAGDVRHSQADISKASRLLGYEPSHTVAQGLAVTSEWFLQRQNTHV